MGTMEQNNKKRPSGGDKRMPQARETRTAQGRSQQGRSAGLSRPDAAKGTVARTAKKSRKDVAKDKMIILAELLCGLLLVSVVAAASAKILSMLGSMNDIALGQETLAAVKTKILLVIVAEILGILVLFGGMIHGRVNRLHRKIKLEKNHRIVMLVLTGIGVLVLIVAGAMGYSLAVSLKESNMTVADMAGRAGMICYIALAGLLMLVAAPVYGEIVYLRRDKETPSKRKAVSMLLKTMGALSILVGIAFTAHTVSGADDIMKDLIAQIRDKMDVDENTTADKIQKNLSEEQAAHMSGYINIAVFGLDSRADSTDNQEAGGLVDADSRSDVIMIVSINCDTKQVKLLSVYRDTCMLVQKKKSGKVIDNYEKITHAYFNGSVIQTKNADGTTTNQGPIYALNALNRNLDLDITEYVSVNFDIVRQAIEKLGGLEIEIDKGELKYINQYIDEINQLSGTNSPHITTTGMQHLDGVQATGYARIRHSDSDYKRTERQREVVQKMLDKAKAQGMDVVLEIVDMVAPQIRTNIDAEKFYVLANDVLNYDIVDQKGFPFDPYWDNAQSVVFAGGALSTGKGLVDEVKELHEFLFGETSYKPSSKLKEISAEIDAKRGKKSSQKDSNKTSATEKPIATPEPGEENMTNDDYQSTTVERATTTPKPTQAPTTTPKPKQSSEPTVEPSIEPTKAPTAEPTQTAKPTAEPTTEPTAEPTVEPTQEPTPEPPQEPAGGDDEPEDDPGL